MNIYSLITVVGGLAFFLFGMNVLSSALKKLAGNRLEETLQKMTDHPLKGLVFGAVNYHCHAIIVGTYGHVGRSGQFRNYDA